jgi:hypothetical protein
MSSQQEASQEEGGSDMRCSNLLRWAAVCAALLIAVAPAGAGAQDQGHEHGHGEMAEQGHEHGMGEMTAEQKAEMEAHMKAASTGSEHAKLAEGVGSYKLTFKMWEAPGTEPQLGEGTAERTMTLGGRVLEEKVTATMMGMPFEGIGRTGYDNLKKAYWSTWTDNMSTGLMVMHGTVRDDGTATFEGDTIDPMTGNTIRMRIEGRMEGDKEVNEFYFPGPDGTEMKGMEIIYEPVG